MGREISERKVLNTIKSRGWEQIDPRGKKKPSPFVRKINGEVCEAYGHFKKGDKLIAVCCTDRRNLGQMIYIRTISKPDDFTGGTNRFIQHTTFESTQASWEREILANLTYELRRIEEGF